MSEGTSSPTYYDLLNLHPSASVQEIRRAYRELSKLYHPDTTTLPTSDATAKFQQLNEAYATLSSPEKRVTYDLKIGYARTFVIQSRPDFNRPVSEARSPRSSAYLDPSDRPLSPGELFALLMIAITFMVCLLVIVVVGLTRGETAFQQASYPARQAIEASQTALVWYSPQPDAATNKFAAPFPMA